MTGTGHVARTLNLAEELRKAGASCSFLLRSGGKDLEGLILNRGFEASFLPIEVNSWATETAVLREILAKRRPDFVLVDSRENPADEESPRIAGYLSAISELGISLISIDGLLGVDFTYDALFLPYVGAEQDQPRYLSARATFLGPEYCILPSEIRTLSRSEKLVERSVSRIVVSFGGGDSAAATEKALEALLGIPMENFEIRAVLGPLYGAERRQTMRGKFPNVVFLDSPPSLAAELFSADIALISGGMTKYEAASCGTPSIIVCQNPYELEYVDRFVAAGSAVSLGLANNVTVESIRETVKRLAGDPALRALLSERGKRMMKLGEGTANVARVVAELSGGKRNG